MRHFVIILALISLSVMNLIPMGSAMDNVEKNDTASSNWLSFSASSEIEEKEEKKEKVLFELAYTSALKTARSGHLLHDLRAVPPERFYLPYEPPII